MRRAPSALGSCGRARRWLARACALALVVSLSGCTTWRMIVTLRADADTNQGRPLQVLVRSVSVSTYRSEPYASLARLVMQPDKSVVRALTIDPQDGYQRRLYLTVPSETPVALYFFYESQSGSWKMLLPPALPWTIVVPLGRNGVRTDAVKECRLGRY